MRGWFGGSEGLPPAARVAVPGGDARGGKRAFAASCTKVRYAQETAICKLRSSTRSAGSLRCGSPLLQPASGVRHELVAKSIVCGNDRFTGNGCDQWVSVSSLNFRHLHGYLVIIDLNHRVFWQGGS